MAAFDGQAARRIQQEKKAALKQFKVRVERPFHGCHAMELWVEGDNILAVGDTVMEQLGPLGVGQDQVTKLIEIERED